MRYPVFLIVVFALLVTDAQGKPRAVPASGVPGTTVELRGVKGSVKRVAIAGRRAKIVARKPLRVVVPAVRAGRTRIVVRGAGRARFRVLAPFRGRFRARPDSARARTATVGAGGGSVTATGRDGTTFALSVPAGALSKDTPITLTPLRSLSGLPGRDLGGVRMAPAGTVFATPAQLTIRREKRTARPLVGLHGDSNGRDARWVASAPRGRSIVLLVHHFSDATMAEITAAGYAQLLAWSTEAGDFDENDIEGLIDALDDYEGLAPGSCAAQQALCTQVKTALRNRIDALAQTLFLGERSYHTIRRWDKLAQLRMRVGGTDPAHFLPFQDDALIDLLNDAAAPGGSVPHEQSLEALIHLTDPEAGGADADANLAVSHAEWIRFLWQDAVRRGASDAEPRGLVVLTAALIKQRADGSALCLQNATAGRIRLESGRAAAAGTGEVAPFNDALALCAAGIAVSPHEVSLAPGETVQFSASGRGDETFTWSADAGTISATGFYTAPEAVGTYAVRATSSLSGARFATAVVNVRLFGQANWTANFGDLTPIAAVSSPDGEVTGECQSEVEPTQTAEWSDQRTCQRSSAWGTASSVVGGSLSRSPTGSSFRTIHVDAHAEYSTTWTAPPGDGAGHHNAAFGGGEAGVMFEVTQAVPFEIDGSLTTSLTGNQASINAHYTLSGPGVAVQRTVYNEAASPSHHDEGMLQPGDYRFSASATGIIYSSGPTSSLSQTSNASAGSTATLTLDP